MILTNELRGIIVSKGLTQGDVAKMLKMSENTFSSRMKKGVFNSDEIYEMINLLDIKDPERIFFAEDVTQ